MSDSTTQKVSADAMALMTFGAQKRSAFAAYMWWLFLGLFAAHKFYLQRTKEAFIQIFLFWGGGIIAISALSFNFTPLIFAGVFMQGAAGVWWLADLFLIPGQIRRHNINLARQIGLN